MRTTTRFLARRARASVVRPARQFFVLGKQQPARTQATDLRRLARGLGGVKNDRDTRGLDVTAWWHGWVCDRWWSVSAGRGTWWETRRDVGGKN